MAQKMRNPFVHHHDHGHDHDHGHGDHDHGDGHDHHHGEGDGDGHEPGGNGRARFEELDPAQQSLADALRVSFGVLKAIMVVLLILYAFSGFFSVGNNEVALR